MGRGWGERERRREGRGDSFLNVTVVVNQIMKTEVTAEKKRPKKVHVNFTWNYDSSHIEFYSHY